MTEQTKTEKFLQKWGIIIFAAVLLAAAGIYLAIHFSSSSIESQIVETSTSSAIDDEVTATALGYDEWLLQLHKDNTTPSFTSTPEEPPTTTPQPRPAASDAVSAVKGSMTAVSSSGRSYLAGSLEGGTAVLVGDAAYWVKGGVVYAANGTAKTWSPGVSYATSPSISYDSVQRAVSGSNNVSVPTNSSNQTNVSSSTSASGQARVLVWKYLGEPRYDVLTITRTTNRVASVWDVQGRFAYVGGTARTFEAVIEKQPNGDWWLLAFSWK